MTKITKLLFRAMGITLMFLWSLGIEAQTANTSVLTWDQEVGCIKYDDEVTDDPIGEGPPGLAVNLMEGMEDGNCLRFCENSHVNFTLQSSTISTVQWQVSGGNIINNSNTDATIQWGSSGNGSLSITITYTDNSVKTHTICVEKIISPNAYFEIDGINPYQTQFCVDTPISFNNLSIDNGGTAIVNYFWDFGNGSYSNSFEPTYAYHNSGNYKVSLTVTNSCNCSATFEYDIQVDNALPVEIICQNVTCEGMVESYSSSDGCSGDWDVIGGSIIGGGSGSPTIDVLWDQVDPEEGFGYVSYKSHCGCPYWTTVKIPVVIHDPIIKGPDIICEGKQGRFSLPQWPTTDFKWDIDGDPTHPMMVYTDQRNEIIVDGAAPGIYVLRVKYQNTLLGTDVCGGYAEIVFEVVESVKVITSASSTFCAGITESFTTSNGQPVTWKVTMGDNSYEVYGPTLNYLFDQGGTYVITATYNGCESDPVIIEVIPTPVISADGISGPDKVCLDVPYIYTVNDGDPNAIFVWSVTGGDVIGSNAGNEVAIAFNAPTATVSVVKQYVKNGVICTSVPVTYNVNQLVVNPTIVNNEGLSIFCTSDTYTFTADMHGVEADHMEWEIVGIPASGPETTNFGSIINGIFENTVTVGINEITGGVVNGELRLHVTKCGVRTPFVYPITLKQLPDISFTTNKNEYCPGEGVEFTVMTTGVPGITSGNINIYVDGNLKASTAYNNGVPTAPVFNLFDNITDDNVQRLITVEYDGGCKFNPRASQPVIVFPQTRVTLSSPQRSRRVCDSPQLYATLSIGITQTTEFHWYLNGTTSVGGNSDILTINSPGTYHVEVKDKNGCWAISDTVTYVGCSDPDPGEGGPGGTPCDPDPNPGLAITSTMTACNTFTATLSGYTTGTIRWYGSEHVSLTSPQGVVPATYEITELGFHWIRLEVDYGSCSTYHEERVTNYYEAGLKAKVSCNGDGTYMVILENNSRVHDPKGITVNYEYFKGTTLLTSTTDANVLPGTHNYTIKVSSPDLPGVVCEKTITLELPDEPNVDFMVPAPNTEYCSDEPVLLKIQNFNALNTYEWMFGFTSFKTDQEETLINLAEGTHNIQLRATGPYGCMYETTVPVNIQINKAEFDGAIDPNPLDFCEGSTIPPLSFSPTNSLDPMPSDIIWMRDNEEMGTGLTFTPTESGSYWGVLVDPVNGCKYYKMAEKPVIVTVRKPPFASINGNTSVCFGGSTTLTGIYTDPNVEHRWTLNGNPLAGSMGTWGTGATNLTLTLSGLTPGSYTYAFETRDPADPSCVNSFEAVVVFHSQVTPPNISFSVINCQPYTLQLNASGPVAGTYVWSNGMTGQSIEVTHGGAYSVTYTAPTGCSATGYTQAPHNPERTLWIVPQGCYSICAGLNPYLLAPFGVYNQYNWTVNGWSSQSGNNFVPNQWVNQTGDYQLAITQFGCTFYSSKPQIDVNFGCRMINGVMQAEKEIIPAVFKLNPNPTTESTTASYEVGSEYRSATSITIHDVSGVQRLKINVSGTEGQVNLNVGHLSPGTYLVNLQADGQNIAQQKLIKK